MIAIFRSLRFLIHLCYGLSLAIIYPHLSLKQQKYLLQRWSSELLQILNVQLCLPAEFSAADLSSGLVVSNHVSWLDIFVLNTLIPMRFVAKSEVRQWPILGWLSERAQTLFIERGSPRSAARINQEMVGRLKQGESFAVFPEGTTSIGLTVLNFHSSLFQPAIEANVPVTPITLRYQNNVGAFSSVAAFIDDLSFGTSLWRILNTRALHVQLCILDPIPSVAKDRRTLAQLSQQSIATALEDAHSQFHLSHVQENGERHSFDKRFQSLFSVLLNSGCNTLEREPK